MKHEVQARYPASPDVVIRMFTDKAFHTKKLEALGMPYKVLAHEFDGKTFRIRMERKVPVQILGGKTAEATIVSEEVWNVAGKSGKVSVDAGIVPLDSACTTSMKAEGKNGTTVTYVWEVKSKVPLVGGKIEKMAISDMDARFGDETRAALALLDSYR